MKLLLFVLSFSVFAENWYPVGKPGAKSVYTAKTFCESVESVECFEVSACPQDVCEIVDGEAKVNPAKQAAREARIAKELKDAEDRLKKKNERKAKLEAFCSTADVGIKEMCEELIDGRP